MMTILHHHISLHTKNLFVLLNLPICEQNELKSKYFIKKFYKFKNDNFRLAKK